VASGARRDPRSVTVHRVSTRLLILAALVCGMALLMAFAVQVLVSA